MKQSSLVVLVALCSLVISACGGGSGGGGTDISGVWTGETVTTGAPAPKTAVVPVFWNIQQSGPTVTGRASGFAFSGTFDGTTLSCTGTSGDTSYSIEMIVADGNSMGGTFSSTTEGSTTNYQMTFSRQGTPSGTLTCTGDINGNDVSINSSTAFGYREVGIDNYRTVYHLENSRCFRLSIGAQNALAVGSYTIVASPSSADHASLSVLDINGSTSHDAIANGGSLNITSISDGVISGSMTGVTWDRLSGGLSSVEFSAPTLVANVTN